MNVAEIGEFGLIKLLAEMVGKEAPPDKDLILSMGDDTAAWKSRGLIQLATTDTLVQNVHFDLKYTDWQELGHKAIAVSLSDIAAMGGIPQYALVALSLPRETLVENVTGLYRGMIQIASRYNVQIIGGNITSAGEVVINVSLTGYLNDKNPMLRSGAEPGDQIAITGHTGLSAAGAAMLKHDMKIEGDSAALFRKAQLQPEPRVSEGQLLQKRGVKAAIDISDGLLADLRHICTASNVSARIRTELIPIHPFLKKHFPEQTLDFALAGGEDYELLFCADAKKMAAIKQELVHPLNIIGEIGLFPPGKVEVLDEDNNDLMLNFAGWEHFKSST